MHSFALPARDIRVDAPAKRSSYFVATNSVRRRPSVSASGAHIYNIIVVFSLVVHSFVSPWPALAIFIVIFLFSNILFYFSIPSLCTGRAFVVFVHFNSSAMPDARESRCLGCVKSVVDK